VKSSVRQMPVAVPRKNREFLRIDGEPSRWSGDPLRGQTILQTTLLSADFISFIPGATHDTFPVSLRPFPGREAEESGGKLGRTQASARNGGGPPPVIAFANITVPQLPKNWNSCSFPICNWRKVDRWRGGGQAGTPPFRYPQPVERSKPNRDARRTSRPTR